MKEKIDAYVEKIAHVVSSRGWRWLILLIAAPLVFTGVLRLITGKDLFADLGAYAEITIEILVLGLVGAFLCRTIAKRARIIQELREREERNRQLFDAAPEPMVVHRGDKILLANAAAARALGLENAEDFVGRSVLDFVLPEDLPAVKERLLRVELGRLPVPLIEVPFVRLDGTVMQGEAISVPIMYEGEPAMLSVGRDITERKRAAEALKESEKKYRLVVDNAQEGIFVAQDGMLRFVNPVVSELTGYSVDELLQKPFSEVIFPDDRETIAQRHRLRMQGEGAPWRFRVRFVTKAGDILWAELESVLITWEDRPAALCFATDITARKQAEEALKESEKRYRELVENANDAIYLTDAQGSFVIFNPVALRLTGYSAEEIHQVSYLDLVHPDYRKQTERFYGIQYVKKIRDTYYEVPILTKQGETVWIGQRVQLVMKEEEIVGFQAICRDITERKRAEQALRASEERFRSVFNNATVGINVSDRSGRFLHVNSASANMLGYDRDELRKITVFDVTYPADVQSSRVRFSALVRGEMDSYRVEKRYVRKDGSTMWADVFVSAIGDDLGDLAAAVAIVVDITDRKRMEEQQEVLRTQLVHAQKMEAVGTLTGGIAHEFNNILTVILGFAEMLLMDKDESDSEHEDLQKIVHSARRGAELIAGLLAFSGKATVQLRAVNLNDVVMQARRLLDRTIPKMIELQVDLAQDLKAVEADSAHLTQAVVNLALNAAEAMPEGGKLTVTTKNVVLGKGLSSGMTAGEYVQLSVSDTGIGMDERTVQRIFEPFYSGKGLAYKTGLGLAVVHGMVQSHGGHILCESRPGQGTTFKVFLPALADTRMLATPSESPIVTGKETILLVDDEELVRELGMRLLSRLGYTVLPAGEGLEAVALYEEKQKEISLVILDLIMPKMGGKQCLQRLLRINPLAKILIASGFSDAAKLDELIVAGAAGFVPKPFGREELSKAVRQALDSD